LARDGKRQPWSNLDDEFVLSMRDEL